jgi:hypothetical protein
MARSDCSLSSTDAGLLYHHQDSKYSTIFLCSSLSRLANPQIHCQNSYARSTLIMSFQRLHNNSTRYTNAPITARRFSDDTDNDSVTSSQSGSVASDDGTESGHPIDHDTRELRRRHAQARINNTLQYAYGRFNHIGRPVQGLANGVAEGGDSFYHDVARPFFDEVLFKIRVTVTVAFRLFFLFVWYIAELPVRFIWCVLDLAQRSFWSVLNLIDASIWYVLDLTNASFWFLIDMAQSWFGVLRQAYFATADSLHDVQWWMWKPIAILLAAFIIFVVIPAISIGHGFTSMATYLCSDASISPGWTGFPEICKHSNINAVLSLENAELLKLTAPSHTILHSVRDLLENGKEIPSPRNALVLEATAVKEFAWLHQEDLEAFPFFHNHNISQITEAIHGNATIFNAALENFRDHHRNRVEELELRVGRLLDSSRNFSPHSPFQRCFSESLCHYFPSLFSYSSVARRNTHYLSLTTHLLETPEATTIPQHAVAISKSQYNIAYNLAIAKDALQQYEPYLTLACNSAEISGVKCHQNPLDLIGNLETAFATAQTAAAKVAAANKLHKASVSGLRALKGELRDLMAIAVGKTAPVQGDVDAAAARAVLHRFMMQVKSLEVVLGEVPREVDDGIPQASIWERDEEGNLVSRFKKYYREATGWR